MLHSVFIVTSVFAFYADDAALIAQNRFGHKLFASILEEKSNNTDNVFISPPSAFFALSMLLEGAAGPTRSAILDGLGMHSDEYFDRVKDIHSANFSYLATLEMLGHRLDNFTLTLSNAFFWSDDRPPLSPEFGMERSPLVRERYTDALEFYYGAEALQVDFGGKPKEAANKINNWAAGATNGRIPVIIDETAASQTSLLLVNAVYFKGAWQYSFDPQRTREQSHYFTMSDGTSVDAKVMNSTDSINFYHKDQNGAQVAMLPFEGESLGFYVVLPPEGVNAKKWMVKHATNDSFWTRAFIGLHGYGLTSSRRPVFLEIPKFKFSTGEVLNDNLRTIGMGNALDTADLSNMFRGYPTARSLRVKQDTFVQVDEEGAEAAAITTIVGITGAPIAPQPPLYLRLNRPFAFAIRDEIKGVFLFHGLVERPVWSN